MKHALLLLLIPAAIAQEPTPTFRSTTRLVEASVSVTDSNGRPVVGLSKADFTVTAGGRNRPIAFLQFDGVAGMKRDLKPLPRYVCTNRPEYSPAAARNVTAVVIHELDSPYWSVTVDGTTVATRPNDYREIVVDVPAGTRTVRASVQTPRQLQVLRAVVALAGVALLVLALVAVRRGRRSRPTDAPT